MKLNVVADRNAVERSEAKTRCRVAPIGWMLTTIVGLGAGFCMMSASSALALDGIDLSQPVEAAAPGECPKLIQIKYPFLSCKAGIIGLADGDATWENSRQIPIGSDFVEGNGYWGDDLNQE